jgi:hypothetical protein
MNNFLFIQNNIISIDTISRIEVISKYINNNNYYGLKIYLKNNEVLFTDLDYLENDIKDYLKEIYKNLIKE